MNLTHFESLLKDSIGLDAASIGSEAVARAVQARQSACDLKDPEAYWQRAWTSEMERQELIEAVVVPETWFFRDRCAFDALVQVACGEWGPAHATGVLRVLSLPCSTGEEPYSVAMALLDAGLPPNRFHVDAVDISMRAIARAARAVYGRNSFRADDLAFRDRHFAATPSGYALNESVRRQVTLRHGNVFTADCVPGATGAYDVVFCRNLLIYFDRHTQDRAIRVMEQLLSPTGVLFVAPSETGLPISHNFTPMRIPQSFGFRRAEAPAPKPQVERPGRRVPVRAAPAPRRKPVADRPTRPTETHAPDSHVTLEAATRLADLGRFDDAIRSCQMHVQQCGPSAEAFRLLGVVHDARGSALEAVDCYRKALYLDPNQVDVLIHLALLMERLQKPADAHVLRNRARRLEQKAAHP